MTDETHNRRYVQIDLAEVAEKDEEQLEDMMDIIVAEARKDDEKITMEELESQLKAEGRLKCYNSSIKAKIISKINSIA